MYWSVMEAISRDLDRLSGMEHSVSPRRPAYRSMPVNLYQSEDAVTVSAELPGVAPGDVDVTVADGVLHLVAERKPVERGENDSLVVQEQPHGKFMRRVRLPFPVAADEISASLQQGVLRVTLPKRADAKPRRIDVTSA